MLAGKIFMNCVQQKPEQYLVLPTVKQLALRPYAPSEKYLEERASSSGWQVFYPLVVVNSAALFVAAALAFAVVLPDIIVSGISSKI